jgi:hypothetical protein
MFFRRVLLRFDVHYTCGSWEVLPLPTPKSSSICQTFYLTGESHNTSGDDHHNTSMLVFIYGIKDKGKVVPVHN